MTNESALTEVSRRALDLHDRVVKRVKDEMLTPPLGTQAMNTWAIHGLIRRVLSGDEAAMAEVTRLAIENGHVSGEPQRCPVCVHIAEVMRANRR